MGEVRPVILINDEKSMGTCDEVKGVVMVEQG